MGALLPLGLTVAAGLFGRHQQVKAQQNAFDSYNQGLTFEQPRPSADFVGPMPTNTQYQLPANARAQGAFGFGNGGLGGTALQKLYETNLGQYHDAQQRDDLNTAAGTHYNTLDAAKQHFTGIYAPDALDQSKQLRARTMGGDAAEDATRFIEANPNLFNGGGQAGGGQGQQLPTPNGQPAPMDQLFSQNLTLQQPPQPGKTLADMFTRPQQQPSQFNSGAAYDASQPVAPDHEPYRFTEDTLRSVLDNLQSNTTSQRTASTAANRLAFDSGQSKVKQQQTEREYAFKEKSFNREFALKMAKFRRGDGSGRTSGRGPTEAEYKRAEIEKQEQSGQITPEFAAYLRRGGSEKDYRPKRGSSPGNAQSNYNVPLSVPAGTYGYQAPQLPSSGGSGFEAWKKGRR